MSKKVIGFVNTLTDEVVVCSSWKELAETVSELTVSTGKWDRFLPFCNGWNLDYLQWGETPTEYKVRLIDMAIGLQLI